MLPSDAQMIGFGLYGIIFSIGNGRAVKIPQTYGTENISHEQEFVNKINQGSFANEKKIYERLGEHEGIIKCFKITQDMIELTLANQGDLETYIRTNAEPQESVKARWVLSLCATMSYIHSKRVFLDEIAPRNILVHDNNLKFCDFGQSYLLPIDANIETTVINQLTAKIEMLHLGWVIYSISIWKVNKYYHFNPEDQRSLPSTNSILYGTIINKCWNEKYTSVDELLQEIKDMIGDIPNHQEYINL